MISTNYRTAPPKEKQNPSSQKSKWQEHQKAQITTTMNDDSTKRRAKTLTLVNYDDVIALTRRKTKVSSLVNNTILTQPTLPKNDGTAPTNNDTKKRRHYQTKKTIMPIVNQDRSRINEL
ncbi:21557_t:CDS:2, partial [Gigaspora rosea]